MDSLEIDDLSPLTGLQTRVFGRAHEHHRVLASTNDRAWAWFADGAPHGGLVTADEQTKGRGRMGRSWSSPGGGHDIYASLILRSVVAVLPKADNHLALERLAGVALVAAVAVREAVVDVAGMPSARVGLKWPNDVLVDRRKLAGILCEGRVSARGADVVVGIGCNVRRREFVGDLTATATSIALAVGDSVPTRRHLLERMLLGFEDLLPSYVARGFAAIRGRYEPHSLVLGQVVELRERPDHARSVLVEALDDCGRLRVRPVGGGAIETVASGEVSLRLAP